MTDLLQDRERAAEWGFVHAGEVRFLTHCSALRALGSDAAARMRLSSPDAGSYAETLVAASIGGVKDNAIIESVRTDLQAHGIVAPAEDLRASMARYLARAELASRAA